MIKILLKIIFRSITIYFNDYFDIIMTYSVWVIITVSISPYFNNILNKDFGFVPSCIYVSIKYLYNIYI